MIYEPWRFCLLLFLLLLLLFIGCAVAQLSAILSLCLSQDVEDPRTESLREYCYGLMLPIICALGIIGNVLNLIVLTRRNMRGTAYIYMRGKSAAACFLPKHLKPFFLFFFFFCYVITKKFNFIDCLQMATSLNNCQF